MDVLILTSCLPLTPMLKHRAMLVLCLRYTHAMLVMPLIGEKDSSRAPVWHEVGASVAGSKSVRLAAFNSAQMEMLLKLLPVKANINISFIPVLWDNLTFS